MVVDRYLGPGEGRKKREFWFGGGESKNASTQGRLCGRKIQREGRRWCE